MALFYHSIRQPLILCLSVLFFTTFGEAVELESMYRKYKTGLLLYNLSVENGRDFHIKYCRKMCIENRTVTDESGLCGNPRCLDCNCSPVCSVYNMCCPSLNSTIATLPFKNVPKEQEDILLATNRFQCDHFPGKTETHYFMINDCPADYTRQQDGSDNKKEMENKKKCHNPPMTSMDAVIPYLDLDYGITFKNKFCAMCNGYKIDNEPETKNAISGPWAIETKCKHYQNLYHFISEIDFFYAAIKEGCGIEYKPPNSTIGPQVCDPKLQGKDSDMGVSTCTGSDPVLNFLCHNLTANHFKVYDKNNDIRARNIFCYMCNGHRPLIEHCEEENSIQVGPLQKTSTPISLLLGVQASNEIIYDFFEQNCKNPSDWRNEAGECQPSVCTKGKNWNVDGNCHSVIKQIRGLGYKMSIILSPARKTVASALRVMEISKNIDRMISAVSKEVEISINITVFHSPNSSRCYDLLHQISLTAYIVGSERKNRDELEAELLDMVESSWNFELTGGQTENLTLKPLVFGSEKCDWHQNEDRMSASEIDPLVMINKDPQFPMAVPSIASCYQREYLPTVIFDMDKLTDTKMYRYLYLPERIHNDLWSVRDKFIEVHSTLLCPYVAVNTSGIFRDDSEILAMFTFQNWNINVTLSSEVSMVNGELHICLDLFKNLTSHILTQHLGRDDPLLLAQYYFEIVCFSISITCLFITFITYGLFPILRSVPGLNNMTLSISLAAAQICLLITAQYGLQGLFTPIYCTIHAVITHYLWLVSFAWMSACCVHMYRVFTRHITRSTQKSNTKMHLYYCAYTFGCPLLIVIATVGCSLAVSKGKSYGYDDTICFLDRRTSILVIILSFLVPLAVVVLSNAVLFILTIREILQVKRLNVQSHNSEGQGVIAYVKLSTLTGVLCGVTAAAVHLQNPVLNFFVSPLITLQGLFIFLSFIINKRVGKLYSELLTCHRPTVSSSKTSESDQKPPTGKSKSSIRTLSTNV